MESNDIVTRLREVPNGIGGYFYKTTQQAADEIERLRAERDEARRSCCEYAAIVDGADNTEGMESGRFHEVAMRYMKERNWDCFKEDDK